MESSSLLSVLELEPISAAGLADRGQIDSRKDESEGGRKRKRLPGAAATSSSFSRNEIGNGESLDPRASEDVPTFQDSTVAGRNFAGRNFADRTFKAITVDDRRTSASRAPDLGLENSDTPPHRLDRLA